jgi:hypothetical protein
MKRMSRSHAVLALALTLAVVGPHLARSATPADRPQRAPGELENAAREYRESLERLLPFREDAVAQARAQVETRRRHFEGGLIARRDVEAAEQALAEAETAAAKTRQDIEHVDLVMAETLALATLPPARAGATVTAGPLMRFHGTHAWSFGSLDVLERFFAERFGRALPVSALGQTAAHDRLGFDHRNALDVAVHPDSAEGRALLEWLRARGVSFLAFRSAVAGEATGAHVHIGEPSPRLVPPAPRS